jgi:outer membrane protein TolC
MVSEYASSWSGRHLWRSAVVVWAAAAVTVYASLAKATDLHLTLPDAVTQALRDAPEAKIAQLEAGQADDALSAMQSAYWPRASISSDAGYSNRFNEKLKAVDGNGQLRRYNLATIGSKDGWFNFHVEQLLFDLSRWRNIKSAELEAEAARVAGLQRREVITFGVLERYVDVLRLEELLQLDQGRVRQGDWLDEQAAFMLKAGQCLPAEREQVALSGEEARLQAAMRTEELAHARARLRIAIGVPDTEDVGVRLVRESLPVASDQAVDQAVEARVQASPEVRVLDIRRVMEETKASATRAEALPTLGAGAGYTHYGAKRLDNFVDEMSVGVRLRMPLFEGFRIQHAVAGATKAAEIARLRHRSLLETKRANVRELRRRLVASAQQPELARRRAHLAEERLRVADLNLRARRGNIDQSLAAREEVVRHGTEAVAVRFDRVILWATLQRETGELASTIVGDEALASLSTEE